MGLVMSCLTPGKCLLPVLLLAVGVSGPLLEGKPRRLSDLGGRSAVENVRFSAPMQDIKMNDRMQGQRVEFGQWHGAFSSIGGKRAGVSTEDRFNSQMLTFANVEHKEAGIAIEAAERQMAPLRNVNQMRDIVIAQDFNKMAPRTVEGRAMQEMVDEMSLKDINRFQVHRNKTDEGVPVQEAGSGQGPSLESRVAASGD